MESFHFTFLFYFHPVRPINILSFHETPPHKEEEDNIKSTRAVCHLLQRMLNSLNLQREVDEAEQKREEKELQHEK